MQSQYSEEHSHLFSAALKVMPEAEHLVVRDGRVFIEATEGRILAEVIDGEFVFPGNKKVRAA